MYTDTDKDGRISIMDITPEECDRLVNLLQNGFPMWILVTMDKTDKSIFRLMHDLRKELEQFTTNTHR